MHKKGKLLTVIAFLSILTVFISYGAFNYFRIGNGGVVVNSSTSSFPDTKVLGVSTRRALAITSIVKKSPTEIEVEVINNSQQTLDFSPGLQLFGVTPDGLEIPIRELSDTAPLDGGPIEANATKSGTIEFSDSTFISAIRLYQDTSRTIFDTSLL